MGSSVILPEPGQPGPQQPGDFVAGSIPNIVTFGFDKVGPPSAVYVQRDDQLVFEGQSLISGNLEAVTINARLLSATAPVGGQPGTGPFGPPGAPLVGNYIVGIQRTIANLPLASPQIVTIPLAEGYLLSLTVACSAALARGQTFVRAWINRGPTAINNPNAANILLSDYVTQAAPVGWPVGRVVFPTEGPGNLRTVSVTNPAAGADWTTFVPSGARWRVQSWNAQLVIANAGVARIIRSIVQDTVPNIVWQGSPSQTGAINTTVQVSASSGNFTAAGDPGTITLALPSPCMVPSAGAVRVSTSNINAADQWSLIRMQVEEWADLQ